MHAWSPLHDAPSVYLDEAKPDPLISATFMCEEETQRAILTQILLVFLNGCAGFSPCGCSIAEVSLPLVVYFQRGPLLCWLGQVPVVLV